MKKMCVAWCQGSNLRTFISTLVGPLVTLKGSISSNYKLIKSLILIRMNLYYVHWIMHPLFIFILFWPFNYLYFIIWFPVRDRVIYSMYSDEEQPTAAACCCSRAGESPVFKTPQACSFMFLRLCTRRLMGKVVRERFCDESYPKYL